MAVAVIGVVAVFFLGMGVYAIAAPAALVRPFGIWRWGSLRQQSEVRAVYGGFGLAIAGVLVYAAVADGDVRTGILITVGAALAGMAFGRLAAADWATARRSSPNWFFFLVEVVAAVAFLQVLRGLTVRRCWRHCTSSLNHLDAVHKCLAQDPLGNSSEQGRKRRALEVLALANDDDVDVGASRRAAALSVYSYPDAPPKMLEISYLGHDVVGIGPVDSAGRFPTPPEPSVTSA